MGPVGHAGGGSGALLGPGGWHAGWPGGREGRADDPACPMKLLAADPAKMAQIPLEQLNVFFGFHHARRPDPARGAPRIGVEDFRGLVPREIRSDPELEEAFTDVCLSDGAWELYQR